MARYKVYEGSGATGTLVSLIPTSTQPERRKVFIGGAQVNAQVASPTSMQCSPGYAPADLIVVVDEDEPKVEYAGFNNFDVPGASLLVIGDSLTENFGWLQEGGGMQIAAVAWARRKGAIFPMCNLGFANATALVTRVAGLVSVTNATFNAFSMAGSGISWANGGTLTLTGRRFKRINFAYFQGGTGTFTFAVTGLTSQVVNVDATGVIANSRVTFSREVQPTESITITWAGAGTGYSRCFTFEEQNAVSVMFSGYSGVQAGYYTSGVGFNDLDGPKFLDVADTYDREVWLELGANEFLANAATPKQVYDRIMSLAGQYLGRGQAYWDQKVVVFTPPPCYSQMSVVNGLGYKLEDYAASIKQAGQDAGATVVDIFNAPSLQASGNFRNDGIHLSARGNRNLAAFTIKTLEL